MSVRVKETRELESELESNTHDERTVFEDKFLKAKIWRGDPPDVPEEDSSILLEEREKLVAPLDDGIFGVKLVKPEVLVWFHKKDTAVNYAVLFDENTSPLDIADSLFSVPKENPDSDVLENIARPLLTLYLKFLNFHWDISDVSNTASNVTAILAAVSGQQRGVVPAIYTLENLPYETVEYLGQDMVDKSCAGVHLDVVYIPDIEYIGVSRTSRRVWLWYGFSPGKPHGFLSFPNEIPGAAIIVARNGDELLEFLASDETGSLIAGFITKLSMERGDEFWAESEECANILGRLRLFFT